jgi:hypothetical protein
MPQRVFRTENLQLTFLKFNTFFFQAIRNDNVSNALLVTEAVHYYDSWHLAGVEDLVDMPPRNWPCPYPGLGRGGIVTLHFRLTLISIPGVPAMKVRVRVRVSLLAFPSLPLGKLNIEISLFRLGISGCGEGVC